MFRGITVVIVLSGWLCADEVCPGCLGQKTLSCGRCPAGMLGAFVGRCSHCCGPFAVHSGGPCPVCHGTQVCTGCAGRGMACLVCKGSGRVPDGTAASVAAERARRQAAGIETQVTKRLAPLLGRWRGEGRDADGGPFTTEIRWTRVLGGSFLRHDERLRYASGAAREYVSFLTWVESEQQYLWMVFFAPGRAVPIRGTQGEGRLLAWQMPQGDGSVVKLDWTLQTPDRIALATHQVMGDRTRAVGNCVLSRIGADPGGAIVTDGPHSNDEASQAVRGAMKPLAPLLGRWTGTGEDPQGAMRSETRWSAILGATVYESDSTTHYASGVAVSSRALMTVDPQTRQVVYVHLDAAGGVSLFKGQLDGARVSLDINGVELVWHIAPDGRRIDWTAHAPTAQGERRLMARGVDVKD